MKYFVCSDLHGCYKPFIQALEDNHFDRNIDTLIVLGDMFDRGTDSKAIWEFIRELPNKVCVRGNHESLLLDVFNRGTMDYMDRYNGLPSTIASFANCTRDEAVIDDSRTLVASLCGVEQWIKHEMVWYYETPHYLFVHGWVPENDGQYLTPLDEIHSDEWDDCSWSHVPERIMQHIEDGLCGYYGKTIVFGHWHTKDLHDRFDGGNGGNGIWRDDEHKLIGLDGCTNLSHTVNMLVIDENDI